MRRIIAAILSLAICFSAGGTFHLSAEEVAETKIVNLKTDDQTNPFGIDHTAPQFSWQMDSAVVGQKQTAYKITVAKDEAFHTIVWDSGKKTDGRSVGISYAGDALTSSTAYYWKVTVWDKSGVQVTSDPATFEMGLLDADDWNSSQWISAGSAAVTPVGENFHYVVEGDFTCQDTEIGMIFNYLDTKNFYMWQINSNGFSAGKVLMRPHNLTNGSWDTYNNQHEKDITAISGGVEALKTTAIHMAVDVTKTEIKTYINGTLVDTLPFANNKGIGPYLGKIGVRTSGSGRGTVANLKMTDYTGSAQGVAVYDYNFADSNPFFKGSIENGAFVAYEIGELVPPDAASIFRKEFTPNTGKTVKSAKLYSTGLGVFDVFLNDRRVGTKQADGSVVYDELKPGFTMMGRLNNGSDPEVLNTRVNYFSYDVTDMLNKKSANAISAIVTSGWWTGSAGGSAGKNTAFRAQLLITYTDGSKEVIGTDTSWKSSKNCPYIMADIWNGEAYNPNIDASWKNSGYDDASWNSPVINSEFSGMITAVPGGSKVHVRKDLERKTQSVTVYDSVTGAADDRYGKIHVVGKYGDRESFTLKPGEKAVFDLGQNFSGWPEIELEGAKNTVVTMRHGEMLNDNDGVIARGNDGPQGSLFTDNLHGAAATATYIMGGNGVETYHSTYTFYGFRYVEVSATKPIAIHGMKGLVVTSVAEETGSLSTSNALVNQLISNIKWGQYSNYLSIPTDCPQRAERQGWTADTQVFSTTAAYLADSKGFLAKWMTDMRDSQWPNGNYPEVAPRGCFRNAGAAGWSDGGVIVPYNLYKMYGDQKVIEDNYDSMSKFMDFMASRGKEGGILVWGDWLGFENNDDTMKKLIAVAYYAWDAQMMAEMAAILGKTEDVTKYNAIYTQEKEYFQQLFVNPDGSMKRTEQTACLMALKMDLLPNEASRQKAKQALLDNIKRNGDKLQTGFIGTATIMQTLSDIGASDVAYQILLQRNEPSWLYSVDQGATTVWERWDGYTKERGFEPSKSSFNHYSYGAVAEWMYGYMAGIMYDFDNPGFKHVILQPTPDQSIKSVDCSYDSEYGTIVSNWKYEGSKYIYDATVPANTSATIYLPVETGKTLTVNGKQLSALRLGTDGIEYVKTENGKAEFNAVAGSFHFETGITPYCYVAFSNATSGVECLVKINDGELQSLPNMLKMNTGDEITVEAFAGNDADYGFTGWSGDVESTKNKIKLKIDDNVNLTANFHANGYSSIASGSTVTASSMIAGASAWAPGNLVDGITTASSGSMGFSTDSIGSMNPSTKPSIDFDLGSVKEFDRFHLYPRTDQVTSANTTCNFPEKFDIQIRKTASDSWETVAEYDGTAPGRKQPLVVQLDSSVSARYIRFSISRVSDHASDDGANRVQLSEIGVYHTQATPPRPYHKGDVTGDAEVTAADIVALRRMVSGNMNRTIEQFAAGDLNDDDRLSADDVNLLLERLDILPGDVNGDHAAGPLDIMVMRKSMLDGTAASDRQLAGGDMDGNGQFNALDIMLVRKLLVTI